MISKWHYLPLTSDEKVIEARLAERYSRCAAITRLLVKRGMKSTDEVHDFFHPSVRNLHDPFLMRDMTKAVERLNKALGAKEKVLVYGDYDVDGVTAVALVYRYLRNFHSQVEYYIPTRDDEGYGISIQSIDYAHSQGVSLIIVLDCGIKAVEEIAYAKTLGIDFIVCDHHVPDDILPDAAAILNPKLKDDSYPFKELSGCGVGFKFMQGFAQSNGISSMFDLDEMLDLLAVSIVADIVPIVDENRILTYYGLKRLSSRPCVGLQSIIQLCGLQKRSDITINDIVFKIGPRINASGRMQSGQDAVELLVTKDMEEARKISERIDGYNDDRKELDRLITDEANAIIENHKEEIGSRKPIVIYGRDWHKGIIGIVAARLAELYFRPSVVMTYSGDGLATGSSRSVKGFDIYTAIKSTRDLLKNFGGHTNAVGLTLPEENIPEFRRRLTDYVEKHIEPHQVTPSYDVDCIVEFDEINHYFMRFMKMFNPFGPGNPRPIFMTKSCVDCGTSRRVGRNGEHIKLEIYGSKSQRIMNGIAFGMADEFYDFVKSGKRFDILYTIEENRRHGSTSPQLMVKAIRESQPDDQPDAHDE